MYLCAFRLFLKCNGNSDINTTGWVSKVAPTASTEVVAGTTMPATCARRIATTIARTIATIIWASAWPARESCQSCIIKVLQCVLSSVQILYPAQFLTVEAGKTGNVGNRKVKTLSFFSMYQISL